jgi:integrase
MKQIKLTKANLEKLALNPPVKRDDYRTDIPGCYLRAGPSSIRLSVMRRDEDGEQRRLTIAVDPLRIPSLPELKRKLAAARVGPIGAEARKGNFRSSLLRAGEEAISTRQLSPATERNYIRSLSYLVSLTNDSVPKTSSDIRKLHKQMTNDHGAAGANSALKLLRMIMKSHHADDPTFPSWPSEGLRGVWAYEPPRETRIAMSDMCSAWAADLPPLWKSWMRFALLTGMRKSETTRAYKDGDEIVVDNTKNGAPLRLPITDAIERQFVDFSTVSCFKPFSKKFYASTKIWITPHDLRRTFASTARVAGVQQNTISWLMNHSSARDSQTSRYQGRPEGYVLRDALHQIEAIYRQCGYTDE